MERLPVLASFDFSCHLFPSSSGLLGFYELLTLLYFIVGCIWAPRLYENLSKRGPMHDVSSNLFILIMKPRILRKAKLITVLAKNPHGEQTKKEVSVLDVGVKPQRNIPGIPKQSGAGSVELYWTFQRAPRHWGVWNNCLHDAVYHARHVAEGVSPP